MKALVYGGSGSRSWTDMPDPAIKDPEDAIVRVDAVTICGTDLHILKGDVPEVDRGRILGHEAVGTIVDVGSGATGSHRAAGADLVHQCLRALPILPRRPVRTVPRWWWMGTRSPDRRHPGRAGQSAVRRWIPASPARERQ